MKKIIFLITLIFCINTSFAQKKDTITIGCFSNIPPYSYMDDDGNMCGFSVEVIEAIMLELDSPYKYRVYNIDSLFMGDNKNINDIILSECDLSIISVFSINNKLNNYISIPYTSINYNIISTKKRKFFGLKDLTDKTVVVRKGSTSENKIKSIKDSSLINVIDVSTEPIGIRMVADNEADYMVIGSHTLNNYKRYIDNYDLKISNSNFEPLRLSIASRDGVLISNINNVIKTLNNNGTIGKLYDKWIEETKDKDSWFTFFLVLIILVIVTIMALILSYTHRKAAQKAKKELAESLEEREKRVKRFKMALKSTKIIQWEYNIKHDVVTIEFKDGREIKITPKSILEYVDLKDRRKVIRYILECIGGEENDDIIINIYREKNKKRVCNVTSSFNMNAEGEVEFVYGIVNDITDVINYNQEIEELQRSMQLALDAGQMAAWRYNYETQTLEYLYGPSIKGGKITMNEYMSYVHPDDKDILPSTIKSLLNREIDKDIINFRFSIDSKEYKWYSCSLMSVYENNKIKYITGTRRDITKEMNEALELKEKQLNLQYILDYLPIPVYIVNPQYNEVVYSNYEAKSVFGIVEGCRSTDIYRKDIGEKCADVNKIVIKTGNDYNASEIIEFKDGGVKTTLVKKIAIEYDNKSHALISRVDITEQQKMMQTQKAVSVSLPAFKAFTWNIDGRNRTVTYGEAGRCGVDDIADVSTIEKCMQIIYPEDRKAYLNILTDYIDRGEGEFNMVYRTLQPDGIEWWETRGIAETVNDNNESYTVLYGVTINVTSQKLYEISLNEAKAELMHINHQNELILNNTSSGIVYIDADFKVVWNNLSYMKGLKLPEGVFEVGSNCHMAFGECIACQDCPMANKTGRIETWKRKVILGENVFQIQTTPIFGENGIEAAVLRIDNITERAKMIKELEQAKLKAEQSDRLKSAFLANMSHEIRTPLNAIIGFSELLQNTDEAEERMEYMNIINNNNEILLRLIGDVLDLSKIESGTVEMVPEEFDFCELVSELHTDWQFRNRNMNIEFMVEIPCNECMAYMDRNRIIQLFTNFISNAFKYTVKGKIVCGFEPYDDEIKIYVRDTGIGIPADKKDVVFERFSKLDDFAQGTGLGLSICKAIVDALGGKIGFESTENEGSCFWALFPRRFSK